MLYTWLSQRCTCVYMRSVPVRHVHRRLYHYNMCHLSSCLAPTWHLQQLSRYHRSTPHYEELCIVCTMHMSVHVCAALCTHVCACMCCIVYTSVHMYVPHCVQMYVHVCAALCTCLFLVLTDIAAKVCTR